MGFLGQIFNKYCYIAFQRHCNCSHFQLHLGKCPVFPPLLQHWIFSPFSIFFQALEEVYSSSHCFNSDIMLYWFIEYSRVGWNIHHFQHSWQNSLCKGTWWAWGAERLQSIGSQRVGHDWSDLAHMHTHGSLWLKWGGIWCKIRLDRLVWPRPYGTW